VCCTVQLANVSLSAAASSFKEKAPPLSIKFRKPLYYFLGFLETLFFLKFNYQERISVLTFFLIKNGLNFLILYIIILILGNV
ncbi:MAG: hypothetical protein ACRCYK_13765, partial [Aeromonas hydrophila]